jgi:hypothetical protein
MTAQDEKEPPKLTVQEARDMQRGMEIEKWQAMWLDKLKWPAVLGMLFALVIDFYVDSWWSFPVVLGTIIIEFLALLPFLWTRPTTMRGMAALIKLADRMAWERQQELRAKNDD